MKDFLVVIVVGLVLIDEQNQELKEANNLVQDSAIKDKVID